MHWDKNATHWDNDWMIQGMSIGRQVDSIDGFVCTTADAAAETTEWLCFFLCFGGRGKYELSHAHTRTDWHSFRDKPVLWRYGREDILELSAE